MKNLIYILFCLTAVACNSNQQSQVQTDSTKNTAVNAADAGPFDLARLSLNENLTDLMTAQSVKAEPKDTLDTSIWGFEVFRSSNAQLCGLRIQICLGQLVKTKTMSSFIMRKRPGNWQVIN